MGMGSSLVGEPACIDDGTTKCTDGVVGSLVDHGGVRKN
jgi:hypothetical protein